MFLWLVSHSLLCHVLGVVAVAVKSCTECPGLQKCLATPYVSVRLFIMSRRCLLNLSLMRRPVCPMYWQSVFSLCRHCLHCSRYMTLVELQSRLCRMSKVLLMFKNVTMRVPSCMCWHVWQLRRDGHLDIPLGVVVASFFILARTRYSLRCFGLRAVAEYRWVREDFLAVCRIL